MVSEYSLLLFCGDNLSVNLEKGVFVISIDDGWIRFSASSHEVGGLCAILDACFHSPSDKHLISPNNITPESNFKVIRLKEMIIN